MSDAPESRSNYCYRHPDRQSFVLCQRCGRTICAECQTPAAVGVICPECMKEQRQSAPKTKSRVLTSVRAPGTPVMTYSLIGITVAVFVLQLIPGLNVTSALLYAPVYSIPGHLEPWRMITAVFLHSTGFIFHVLLNMYMLWILGRALEPMLGKGRFLALYLISGFAGSVGVLLLASPTTAVVGASGAIFGLFGALIVIHRRLGTQMTQLLVLVGINLVIGFIPGAGIAWQAHVGGLAAGALLGLIFFETRRPDRRSLQVVLIVAEVLVLLALSLRFVLL